MKLKTERRVRSSAMLGVMGLVSIFRPSVLLTIEHAARALRQGDTKAFRAWIVPIRLQHFLYRIRWPCRSRILGTILLILDPVQYELGLHPRWDKPVTLRQRMILSLALAVARRKDRCATLRPLPDVRIDGTDDGTFGRWIHSWRVTMTPNSGTQRTGTQNTSPETESPKPGSLE